MAAEIISLDAMRTKSVPIRRNEIPLSNPQEKIKTAADAWLVDGIIAAAEEMMTRLITTNKPLLPNERVRAMKASAALLDQPDA